MWWMAAIGAAAGLASTAVQGVKERNKLRQQREMAEAAYGYKQDYDNHMFSLQRNVSLENLSIQKSRLAQAFETDLSGFNLGLEGQAQQNQAARIELADNTGMALAQQGASGVKGSNTLDRRIDFAENQFEKQLDIQNRGNSLTIQSMSDQYGNQFQDIRREKDSWEHGGYRMKAKSLSDTYAEQMHGLEMKGYDQAIRDALPGFFDYFTGAMSGASSGMSLGGSAQQFKKDYSMRDYWNNVGK